MPLFWRLLWLNALVGGVATILLMVGPWTVSAPVRLTEAVVLVAGLVVMLAANALLLRVGLSPLGRLTQLMTTIDLLRPGQRLPVTGSSEVAALIRTFNEMIGRLEAERSASSARALSAQESERQRVAQELHDEIGQSLTAVLLELGHAADLAPEPLRADLRHAQETTRDSLNEVRRVARRLRPGVLEDLGLVSALTELTTQFSMHTGLTVRRHLRTDLTDLDPQIELVLYRVAQESLTNAARHADASNVDLTLEASPACDSVLLCVADDGRGLGRYTEGSGIRGMRERALLVGGRLTIEPGRPAGTQVRLYVPVPDRRQ
ncbi:HAMP domain-containing sensor histidine kinase [Actinoallomurus sp. NBC_01490]|uniref:HAMP domain-containing sensor histidine kinase n=1 Tax=Actinoallomurus sp. NBC_01490 TaxID=2903557 RepID=UPI002E37B603|nr:HAMP domain-containing sensor histidine kinase [Actinoallomurus sp. NBC_01490]